MKDQKQRPVIVRAAPARPAPAPRMYPQVTAEKQPKRQIEPGR
ncbi:hypothetical protein [Candidatus Nephthysia bennettiae]